MQAVINQAAEQARHNYRMTAFATKATAAIATFYLAARVYKFIESNTNCFHPLDLDDSRKDLPDIRHELYAAVTAIAYITAATYFALSVFKTRTDEAIQRIQRLGADQ